MKKYKVRWNKVLFYILLPLVIIFLLYFTFFYKTTPKILTKIGYNDEDIKILKELSKKELSVIKNSEYLPNLTKIIANDKYDASKISNYIDLIVKNDNNVNMDTIIYMVNNDIKYDYSEKLDGLINHEYFILSRLDRYMKYDSDDIDTIIISVNSNLDYEFYTNTKPTDIEKGILLIVNKYYYLDKDYHYGELVTMDRNYSNHSDSLLSSEAYEAFKILVDAAEKEGYHIRNNSSYRSYSYQNNLYEGYKKNNGKDWADKWSARPGHSEHQTGLALDVGVKSDLSIGKFGNSKEFIWMKNNSYKYGFILRYPEGKEYITGYGYEPWHYRYVGVDVATYIYEHNITFEEYYAYFIEK